MRSGNLLIVNVYENVIPVNYIHRAHTIFVMNTIVIKCTVCFSFNYQSRNRITLTAICPFHRGFHMLQKDLCKKAQLYTINK